MQKVKIIAEAGCNHQGNMQTALDMILSAKNCGVDYIKFQKRCPKDCVPDHIKLKPHSEPYNSFGSTYLAHREALEFSLQQHAELYNFCVLHGIKYACSVWDIISAKEIITLKPDYIKVPSAVNTNFELLNLLFNEFGNDIHISIGMITREEKQKLFKFLDKYKNRTVIYWTTSEYPVPFERVYLEEILDIKKMFPHVGYSGHHLGISIDIAAFMFGIECLERHFTLDRTWKGTDHAASLEPVGMQKLVRDIKAVEKSLKRKDVEMTEIEKQTRYKLKNPQDNNGRSRKS